MLSKEYVLVSAHLDHLGVGAPINGKTIYSGAMDDASGVATVLETAKKFEPGEDAAEAVDVVRDLYGGGERAAGVAVFCGASDGAGECDRGGSESGYVYANLSVEEAACAGAGESTLGDDAKKVGEAHHIVIAADPEPDRNSFIRTDQYSFVQAGVPALAMKFGWTMGSPEYKAWRGWLAQRYHSTDDDLTQPVDLAAAAQFNGFFADLARTVADDPATPHYLDTSFFKRFETGVD